MHKNDNYNITIIIHLITRLDKTLLTSMINLMYKLKI